MSHSIYRFFSFSQYAINSIANTYLYFSNIKDFNDPFEGTLKSRLHKRSPDELSDKQFIRMLKLHYELKGSHTAIEAEQEIINAFHDIESSKSTFIDHCVEVYTEGFNFLANQFYCCFAQDTTDGEAPVSALKNKLMWSHYSDGMRGFVVEFDRDKLIHSLGESQQDVIGHMGMNYGIPPTIDAMDATELMFSSGLVGKKESGVAELITSKCLEWKYENEFRIMAKRQKVNFSVDSIKQIVIGHKADPENVKTLKSLVVALGLEPDEMLKTASICDKTFDIKVS